MTKHNPIKTELQLSKLAAASRTYEVGVATAPGLVVRVSPKGRKTYRWDRGRGRSPRIITYGSFPSLSLADARKEHEKAKRRHQDGVLHPIAPDMPKNVSQLAAVFYRDRIAPHRKRPEDVRRTLDNDILPALGKMPLRAVTALAVRSVVRNVIERDAKVHAGKVLAHCKQLFKFGVSIGAMETNPAASLEAITVGVEDNQRDRSLSGDEIRKFFHALDEYKRLSLVTKIGLKVLLLTGLRSGELRLTKWDDVDLENGTLTVPVANQKLTKRQEKRGKPFVCTLSPQAVELLRQIQGVGSTWVFAGPNNDGIEQPLSDKVFGKAMRRLLNLENAGGERVLQIDPFTPHDLRRTMRSGLSELRVPPHIAERCLNHSLGRILETYDTFDYQDERREALRKWADKVDIFVNAAGNVTPFREAV